MRFADGETTASYAYNSNGLRVEKIVDGQRTNHVWDGSQQIVADIIDSEYYEAQCYIRGTSLAATYRYQNAVKSGYTYYVQNAHGDVVNLTDAEGAVTKTYRYDAFGVEFSPVIDINVFRYCGEYFDAETGTVYLRARYYQASIGRFTQRDTVAGKLGDPLSLNLYTYCHNNPIFYFDPSGHKAISKLFNSLKHSITNSVSQIKESPKETVEIVNSSLTTCKLKICATVGKHIMDSIQNVSSRYDLCYSKTKGGAITTGIWSYGVNTGWCIDTKGNFGNIETFSLGLEPGEPILNGEVGYTASITRASTITDLAGFGMDIGASGGAGGIIVGASGTFVPVKNNKTMTTDLTTPGASLFIGPGTPQINSSVHWNYSFVQKTGNVFDIYNGIYERIMNL